jgi:hypothetical protein
VGFVGISFERRISSGRTVENSSGESNVSSTTEQLLGNNPSSEGDDDLIFTDSSLKFEQRKFVLESR